jgi:hypothetical protein
MIRAHISEHFAGFGIEIVIANHLDEQTVEVLHVEHTDGIPSTRWLPHAPGTDVPAPTFTLPADSGRALLDALTRHYNGAEDTRALRRDYDAERKRVDEQAKVIADVARALVAKGGAA